MSDCRYTIVDGVVHTVSKCSECPYIDYEYFVCRYPNSKNEIQITEFEDITDGCPLNVKEEE